jgi:hypothetical protein
MIPVEEKKVAKRKIKDTEPSQKKKTLPKAVTGHFDIDTKMTVQELASYFMDSEVGPQGQKEIGSFLFNQFTTAARIDALKSGKIVIESSSGSNRCIDNEDTIDVNINSTQSNGGSSSSTSSNNNNHSSSNDDSSKNSKKLSITFYSNAGKIYEETCNILDEIIIGELVLEGEWNVLCLIFKQI